MGGSSKAQVVGYKYYLGVQLALGHGETDEVSQIIVGERSAWTGSLQSSGSINVSAYNLFGGEKREGGVGGTVTMTNGNVVAADPYLLSVCGPTVPAYIGLTTLIFKAFYWAAMNPYFKAPWIRCRRILKGWARGGTVWYEAKARIGSYDMNPAHIVYQCLTDPYWGMGYSPTDIDDTTFQAAADTLSAESFGLSFIWDQQMSINDIISNVLKHINGSLRMNLSSGKFELVLIRGGYTVSSLVHLDPSNIIELNESQRALWGELANQLTVKYTDREQNQQSVTMQDIAVVEAEGAIIGTTTEYLFIRDPDLAMRVAMRDLNTMSRTLSTVSLTTNRILWDKAEGDLFVLNWPGSPNIVNGVYRITSINKGDYINGQIQVEAIEDVFALPDVVYTKPQPPVWVDPIQPPAKPLIALAIEAPYWEIIKSFSETDIAAMVPGYGFAQALVVRGRGSDSAYDQWYSPAPGTVAYSDLYVDGAFEPGGLLSSAINDSVTSITVLSPMDFAEIEVGNYVYVGTEAMGVVAYNQNDSTITVMRGVLDTVPAVHMPSEPVVVVSAATSGDPTQRALGETATYKYVTRNMRESALLTAMDPSPVTFANRASRPYPPGNIKLNNTYRPATLVAPLTTISWSHRNRLTQTVSLVAQTAGDVAPEVGTTYSLTVEKQMTMDGTWGVALTASAISGNSYAIPSTTPSSIPAPGTANIESYANVTFTNGDRLVGRYTAKTLGLTRLKVTNSEGHVYPAAYQALYPDSKSTSKLYIGNVLRTGDTITLSYSTNDASYVSPPELSPGVTPARKATPVYLTQTFPVTDADTPATLAQAIRVWISGNLGASWTVTTLPGPDGGGYSLSVTSVNNGAYFCQLAPTKTATPGATMTVDVVRKSDTNYYLRYWAGTVMQYEAFLSRQVTHLDYCETGNMLAVYGKGWGSAGAALNQFVATVCPDAATTTNVLRFALRTTQVLADDTGIAIAPGPRHVGSTPEPSLWFSNGNTIYDCDLYDMTTLGTYPLGFTTFGKLTSPYRMHGSNSFAQIGRDSATAPVKPVVDLVTLTGARTAATGLVHIGMTGSSLTLSGTTAVPAGASEALAGIQRSASVIKAFGDVYMTANGTAALDGYGTLPVMPAGTAVGLFTSATQQGFSAGINAEYYVLNNSSTVTPAYALTPIVKPVSLAGAYALRVSIKSVRDGLDSWQTQVVTTTMT